MKGWDWRRKFFSEEGHRRSIRLKSYDYSRPGAYFVTICTKERECVLNPKPAREIVQKEWDALSVRFPNIRMDEFVIMPNHVHGIVVIENVKMPRNVGAIHELPLHRRRHMLLPKIIGYFKMNTAKRINALGGVIGNPFWQRNYYEHIIRHEAELNTIQNYILDNPARWEDDEENPINQPRSSPSSPWSPNRYRHR